MSSHLDILALEPFYGGVRRSMLETIMRCSRHRWTLLKLPPRRIERRLSAAAHWFAEQLSRHWVGRVDMLFTSEALNLADLGRLMPHLAKVPSVVYFHSNQLPDAEQPHPTAAHDIVNLSTATAATEIWFNSEFHYRLFMHRAEALVARHKELSSRNPLPEFTDKTRLLVPPIDLNPIQQLRSSKPAVQRPDVIFVDTRDGDIALLNAGLAILVRRKEKFELITLGPADRIAGDFPRRSIPETSESAQIAAMFDASLYLSVRRQAEMDTLAIRSIASRCWPVVPGGACYDELIPHRLHESCLYDGTPEEMADRIQDAWMLEPANTAYDDLLTDLKPFDAVTACRAIDDRLGELAVATSIGTLMEGAPPLDLEDLTEADEEDLPEAPPQPGK